MGPEHAVRTFGTKRPGDRRGGLWCSLRGPGGYAAYFRSELIGREAVAQIEEPSTGVEACERQPVSGGYITGRLVLSAVGRPVRLRTGQPFHAVLLDEKGRLAGRHLTSHVGTGLSVDLAPGEQRSVVVHAATDSADLRRGTVVPPGTWSLAVVIDVLRGEDAGLGHPGRLVAGPFPVVLR